MSHNDEKFFALALSRQILGCLGPIVGAIRRHDRDLANQLVRAANSVHLNLGESRGRRGGDRRRCFEIASGSAYEVQAAVEAANTWGWLGPHADVIVMIDRLVRILWALQRSVAATAATATATAASRRSCCQRAATEPPQEPDETIEDLG